MGVAVFVQSTSHVDSYYAHTCEGRVPQYPLLEEDLNCDVVVVGAGFSGLHTALRLAEAGKRVIILEASRVGWAASGRNGGQALPGWSSDLDPIEKAIGFDGAKALWADMCWAADELQDLPRRYGFDCDYRRGHLWTAVLPRRVSALREWQEEAAQRWDYPGLEFIERRDLPTWIGSERYQAGLYDPRAAHLNPLKLCLGLAQAFVNAGGQIFERSRAIAQQRTANGYQVSTSKGRVQADNLVLACNTYVDQLDRKVAARILPVGTYQIATVPLGEARAKALIPSGVCVTDNQFVLDYFRLTPDHRLLFGGGCTYLGGLPKDMAAATRPFVARVFPQLADVEFEFAWGGHIDVTRYRTPDIGGQDGRYWMQGYSGHGVLPTLAAARAVSDAILGDAQQLALYQAIPNPAFPLGERFAAPMEAIGKAWYRLRDFF